MSTLSLCLRAVAVTFLFLFFCQPLAVSTVDVFPSRDEEAVICRNVAELLSEGLIAYAESMTTPAWVNDYALRFALRGYVYWGYAIAFVAFLIFAHHVFSRLLWRILLVLTDASPNDSTPFPTQGLKLTREYEGAEAVKAAEDAVRLLRTEGLRVGAVFHGNTIHLENVQQIYGHAYVRIQKASQLAQGVSDLLLMLMREMRTD